MFVLHGIANSLCGAEGIVSRMSKLNIALHCKKNYNFLPFLFRNETFYKARCDSNMFLFFDISNEIIESRNDKC